MEMLTEIKREKCFDSIKKYDAATIICLKESLDGLHVLLGQNECKNFLKSTISTTIIMRYPGEYKLPGGVVEKNETLKQAALRELVEEYIGVKANESNINIHFFNRKETLPIQGKTYVMNNFIAFADENDWVEADLVSIINNNLKIKRERFQQSISDDSYWNMSYEDKCKLSPEVNSVQWFNIEKAIEMLECSERQPIQYVNDFQKQEFIKYGITSRDPMYQTKITLQDVLSLKSKKNIINACTKS